LTMWEEATKGLHEGERPETYSIRITVKERVRIAVSDWGSSHKGEGRGGYDKTWFAAPNTEARREVHAISYCVEDNQVVENEWVT